MTKTKPDKLYFVIMTVIFTVAVIYGVWSGLSDPAANQLLIQQNTEYYRNFANRSDLDIFLYILGNNTTIAFSAVFFGIFLGLAPIVLMLYNGSLLGSVVAWSIQTATLKFFFAAILPHGIIELIGTIAASSYGLWLGVKLFRRIIYGEKDQFSEAVKYSLKKFFTFILPILIVAALVEAFITPIVISHFGI